LDETRGKARMGWAICEKNNSKNLNKMLYKNVYS
jgi:hypothetical protein